MGMFYRRPHLAMMTTHRSRPEPECTFLVLAADIWETGGIGTAMRTFVTALADLYGSDQCLVMSLRGRPHENALPVRVLDEGLVTAAVRLPRWRKVQFTGLALLTAWRRRRGLVVVAGHAHLAPIAWVAALVSRAPFVVWVYGKEAWAPFGAVKRAALHASDAVLAITRFTADTVRTSQQLPPGRVQVVNLCLPTWWGRPAEETLRAEDTVLTVARLDREDSYKGVDTLVRAWPRVVEAVPEARVVVVGDGNDRSRIERIVQALGVQDTVRFLGRVSDGQLRSLYAGATLFALPGRASLGPFPEGEGFGLVFIEAQAAGLPVVAGKAGGAQDAVADGDTGMLVDPEDPVAVGDAIVALLRDAPRRRLMGEAGVSFVAEHFSYEVFRRRIETVLRSTILRRDHRAAAQL